MEDIKKIIKHVKFYLDMRTSKNRDSDNKYKQEFTECDAKHFKHNLFMSNCSNVFNAKMLL